MLLGPHQFLLAQDLTQGWQHLSRLCFALLQFMASGDFKAFYVCSGLIALYNIPRKYKITFLMWRWRTTCQRSLKVVLIRHSWQTQKSSEVHRGLSRLPSEPLVLIDVYVAFFPVLCTKLPSLLSIRCQSGFPHVYVGLYLSVYFSSCFGSLSSPYQRAF